MNGTVERYALPIADPFGIARGTTRTSEAVVVELTHDGTTGVGAVTPSSYYDETAASVETTLPALLDIVESVGDPLAGQRIERRMRAHAPDEQAARCVVSIALADLAARTLSVPLYRQWGLDPDEVPPTTYTVGIDTP